MTHHTFYRLVLLGLASVSSFAFAAATPAAPAKDLKMSMPSKDTKMNKPAQKDGKTPVSAPASMMSMPQIAGQIYFDSSYTLKQDKADGTSVEDTLDKSSILDITRARLDLSGDLMKDWAYSLRLETQENENQQFDVDGDGIAIGTYDPFATNATVLRSIEALIARAYVSWKPMEHLTVMAGRIGTPDITSDRLYYRSYVGKQYSNYGVGTVTHYSGNHDGVSASGMFGPVGYAFGVWKQTDLRKLEPTDTELSDQLAVASDVAVYASDFAAYLYDISAALFDSKSLRVGFGGRLNLSHSMSNGASVGVGVGYNKAPLNMAIIGVVAAQLPNPNIDEVAGAGATAYGASTYKDLSNVAVDLSGVFKSFQLNLGYQSQQMNADLDFAYPNTLNADGTNTNVTVLDATTYNFLSQKGSASSFWVELGYLVMGESYKFCTKNAVISGVKLKDKKAGFEITARYGVEHRKNMLAVLSPVGWSDFNTQMYGTAAGTRIYADIVGVSTNTVDQALVLTIDNEGFNCLGQLDIASGDNFFETKMTGFSVGLNYYVSENAVLKIEYENRHNEFKRGNLQTSWTDSAFNKNVGTLRLRGDYSF